MAPVNDADHAKLNAKWHKAFNALNVAGLEAHADHPIAAKYRAASNAVNHANRSRDFAIFNDRRVSEGARSDRRKATVETEEN